MADTLVLDFNNIQIFKVRMICYGHQVLLPPQHKRDQIGNINLNPRSLLTRTNQNIKIILPIIWRFSYCLIYRKILFILQANTNKPREHDCL